MEFSTIVLSGGGILGSVHLGFLKCLEDNQLLRPRCVAGTSVGSLIGFLLACRVPLDRLYAYFCNMNTTLLKLNSLTNVPQTYGFDDGEYFTAFLMDCLLEHDVPPRITFKELYDRFDVELIVTVTNLVTYKPEYLSVRTTPNMEIVVAVRASCTIPILVSPLIIDENRVYVDGCVSENYPLNSVLQSKQENIHDVIGCNIASWKPGSLDTFTGYLYNLIGCMFQQSSSVGYPNTVEVDCSTVSYFDFDKNTEDRQKLYDWGYTKTEEYLCEKNKLKINKNKTNKRHRRSLSETCVSFRHESTS